MIKSSESQVIHAAQLKDQNNQIFYNKLRFVYLKLPHFIKTEQQLVTRLDKWMYFIKHLEDFETIPEIFKDSVFIQAFATAEIAKYNATQLLEYEESLKTFRYYKATIDSALDEGKLEGKFEIAKVIKLKSISLSDIWEITGLSKDEINGL